MCFGQDSAKKYWSLYGSGMGLCSASLILLFLWATLTWVFCSWCSYGVGTGPGRQWAQVWDLLSGRLMAISGALAEDLLEGCDTEASGTAGTSSTSTSALVPFVLLSWWPWILPQRTLSLTHWTGSRESRHRKDKKGRDNHVYNPALLAKRVLKAI